MRQVGRHERVVTLAHHHRVLHPVAEAHHALALEHVGNGLDPLVVVHLGAPPRRHRQHVHADVPGAYGFGRGPGPVGEPLLAHVGLPERTRLFLAV